MKQSIVVVAIGLVLISLSFSCKTSHENSTNTWNYIAIDSTKQKWGDWNEPDWLRYFGLDFGDVDKDGYLDVISGRYIYKNPAGAMETEWERIVLDDNVDAIFFIDVDGDVYADIIAQALPHIYWYEAIDEAGTKYVRREIANIPATGHVNSQGFEKAQIINGGKEELLIASNGSIYCIEIPDQPDSGIYWPTHLIADNTSDEGIGFGDINKDGWVDIVCGRRPQGEDEPLILVWYEHPGTLEQTWKSYEIAPTEHPIDRVCLGDLTNDGNLEIVITEERYPGEEPDAWLLWFSQNETQEGWIQHKIVQQYSMNNLDLADMDNDGDLDIITNEHKGERLETQLWKNNGKGEFIKEVVDAGKENHLGTQVVDIDNDGDLDIIGSAWDHYKWMHLWRNDSIMTEFDTSEKSAKNVRESITISECTYENRPHFLIHTPKLTYYYDKQGGGFSRIIDMDGNDWVHFKMKPWGVYPDGAASAFRGVPNLVYQQEDDGAGHPGFDKCVSQMTENTIISTSKSGKWQWEWEFFEDYAVLELQKTDQNRNYWFLYEGTPGGTFKPKSSYFGSDVSGPITEQYDYFSGNILWGNYNWMYVGNKEVHQTFYMIQLQNDEHSDMMSFLGNSKEGINSSDGMTVFGFGRSADTKPLLSGKQKFVIGLYPDRISTKTDHEQLSQFINTTFLNNNHD